jgi:hypothetical protein
MLSSPTVQLSENIFGELLLRLEPMSSSSTSDHRLMKSHGNESIQSIPLKSPMWTINISVCPSHVCVYTYERRTCLFSCSPHGILSCVTYRSPVTNDSPNDIRTYPLFDRQTYAVIQSLTVFRRYILLHVYLSNLSSIRNYNGSLLFFSHDGIRQHEPIQLCNRVQQYLADDHRLWAIDSINRTIFFHSQPDVKHEIVLCLAKSDRFVSFDSTVDFLPVQGAINQTSLAILSKDLEQIFIYNKITRELIFTSRFSIGRTMNISNMCLFPHDNSLLLKFDWSNKTKSSVQHSLFVHFNTKNRTIGRINEKSCSSVAIGPHNEILVGFQVRSGTIRCYL